METDILLELSAKYARYNFHREEEPVFKSFSEHSYLMTFEEYKKWVKNNFENYYSIVCLMWKGDYHRIEVQLLDDYTNLVDLYSERHKKNSLGIDDHKKNLKDLLSFAIYFCEYRIQHITFDKLSEGKSYEEILFDTQYFRERKEKWLVQYDKLMKEIQSDLTHSA